MNILIRDNMFAAINSGNDNSIEKPSEWLQ